MGKHSPDKVVSLAAWRQEHKPLEPMPPIDIRREAEAIKSILDARILPSIMAGPKDIKQVSWLGHRIGEAVGLGAESHITLMDSLATEGFNFSAAAIVHFFRYMGISGHALRNPKIEQFPGGQLRVTQLPVVAVRLEALALNSGWKPKEGPSPPEALELHDSRYGHELNLVLHIPEPIEQPTSHN